MVPKISKVWLIQLGYLVLAILCIMMSAQLLPRIQEKRTDYQLTQNRPLENAPPELVLATTALGGLRCFLVDYLWLRATQLREKGSHYEIIQLYDWIGKLEPRIPDVWRYISWEMAYNICDAMPTPEERWRWVAKGIHQLRNVGLRYNQNMPHLYWELGFMISHKVDVNAADPYSQYYQIRWFEIWQDVFVGPPDLAILAGAPISWEKLMAEPEVEKLVAQFQTIGVDIEKQYYHLSQLPQEKREKLEHLWQQPENQLPLQKLVSYLISQRLEQEYNMSVSKMWQLEQKYGHLDWRLPSPHVLYWAEEGLAAFERLKQTPSKRLDASEMQILEQNLDRLQHMALQDNFEDGQFLTLTPYRVVCTPNFSVLDALQNLYEKIQQKWGLEKGRESHEEFLKRAVKNCYMYNQPEKAKEYFTILQKKFPKPEYNVSIDQFVVQDIGRTINFGQRHIIESYILAKQLEAYRGLLYGDFEHFQGLTSFIAVVHARYVERHEIAAADNPFGGPRPLAYFQTSAAKMLRQEFLQNFGTEKGESIWKQIEARFPLFSKLLEKEK